MASALKQTSDEKQRAVNNHFKTWSQRVSLAAHK